MPEQPLVSVVTPVYNGAAYLRECIDSVRAQDYRALEYIILDNASTDDTAAIAGEYARADSRIRVVRNDATLPPIDNWNRAIALIADDSHFCRILHADDMLYPGSLQKMVDLAVANPAIGIVGSLRRRGDHVECAGLPTDRQVFNGNDVARLFLRKEVFALAPTSGLVRSDLVRARQPFYPPHLLHADLAAWLDILDGVDFGFVHEILSFSRVHADSITSTIAERRQTLMREWLPLLRAYGPRYFAAAELALLEKRHLARCHRLLVRAVFERRGRKFREYHLAGLREAGAQPQPLDYARAIACELRTAVCQPARLVNLLHHPRLP